MQDNENVENQPKKVKCRVIKGKDYQIETETKQVKKMFNLENSDYGLFDKDIVIPPFTSEHNLYQFVENCAIFSNCLNIISKNVSGFGFRIENVLDKTKESELKKDELIDLQKNYALYLKYKELGLDESTLKVWYSDYNEYLKQLFLLEQRIDELKTIEIDKEDKLLEQVNNICNNINPIKSINDVLRIALFQGLLYGYSGIEVIYHSDGSGFKLQNIPAHELRLVKRDSIDTEYTYNYKDEIYTDTWKFRRYCQIRTSDNKKIYFKDLLDPRNVNVETGDYSDSPLPDKDEANPLIFFEFGLVSDSEYPKPTWLGVGNDISGNYYASKLNKSWFEDGMMIPMALFIESGVIDEETFTEIKSVFESSKGIDGKTKLIIIENPGEPITTEEWGQGTRSNRMSMRFEKLPAFDISDGQFLKYINHTIKNVKDVFNLPDILLGMGTPYNRATAQMAIEMANQQIFQGYRIILEGAINSLLSILDITGVGFKLNTPNVSDYTQYAEMMKPFLEKDVMTMNDIIDTQNNMFNFENPHKEDGDMFVGDWKKTHQIKVDVIEEEIIDDKEDEDNDDMANDIINNKNGDVKDVGEIVKKLNITTKKL